MGRGPPDAIVECSRASSSEAARGDVFRVMPCRAFVASALLAALLILEPAVRAQGSGASTSEALSSWFAERVGEWRQLVFFGKLPQLNDADAAAATRRIEDRLSELRTRFPLQSLDADGVVLFRCYENLARLQVGEIAWREQVAPFFRTVLPSAVAPTQLPVGYYEHLVASSTTAALTAGEVRALGERELARIHQDLRGVMAALGQSGSMRHFFDYLRTDDRFFYPGTDEGREAYLSDTRRIVAEMQSRLDELVIDPPNAPLDVRRLGGTSESEALPMYVRGGTYLIPMADMHAVPRYLLQGIAYHEGLPGHHLQFSIQRGAPGGKGSLAADHCQSSGYTEGWGFYAERLPYELGLYADSYANAGRLGLEAWRAARAIVDVRVNVDGWSDERALAFLMDNTPLPEALARIDVGRFRVSPGLTTAYLIGKLAIERQRARAAAALGPKFDIRVFHDQVLRHGPMPLAAIEDLVERWIQSASR